MTGLQLLIVGGVAVAIVTAWSFVRQRAARRRFEEDPDAVQLEGRGLSPDRDYLFEFSICVPSQASAYSVAESVRRLGYGATVEELRPGGDWECAATKRIRGSHDALVAVRQDLREIARQAGGSYEFWEVLEGEEGEGAV